jgi:signal transduction histidine kinase
MPSLPPGQSSRRAYVIDDDDVMLLSCREILQRVGYEVETFAAAVDGLARIREAPPPVLLVDLKMPGIDGFEVIRRVHEMAPEVVMVVITGHATIGAAVDAMREGAYDFLPKPFTPAELRLILDRAHERWRLARESERLRREKEAAERRFVTFLSHQLKSPLAAVRQYLDVLLYVSGDELPERAWEWISRSRARLTEMVAMIEDWLTLARIERGETSLPGAAADLRLTVLEAMEAAHAQAEPARVTLFAELGPDPVLVHGDSTPIGMVVANLVGNAIKYNREGGKVVVRVACDGDDALLEVQDTGLGIAAEALPRLFTEFYRVRTPETEKISGTGLGLAICKRIVTELGGRIDVTSEVGKGSTFRVHLRRVVPAEDRAPTADPNRGALAAEPNGSAPPGRSGS